MTTINRPAYSRRYSSIRLIGVAGLGVLMLAGCVDNVPPYAPPRYADFRDDRFDHDRFDHDRFDHDGYDHAGYDHGVHDGNMAEHMYMSTGASHGRG
jgi:hypothetical protein